MANKRKMVKEAINKKQKEFNMESLIESDVEIVDDVDNVDNVDNVEVLDKDDIIVEEIDEPIVEEFAMNMKQWQKNKNDINDSMAFLESPNSISIDREQEDKDVIEFQKTGDLKLLEKLYKNRIPTLKNWASKHFYPGLITSVEDLFEDLSVVFLKTADKYDSSRGSFNTCLWNFMLNRLKNLKSSRHAKKRISEEYKGAISSMILSLDFSYSDSDGSDLTLKDIIPGKEDGENSLDFRDIISFLSKDDEILRGFFVKVSDGGSLASLLKEYKMREGKVDISNRPDIMKKLNARKSKNVVKQIIEERNMFIGSFKVISYELCGKNNSEISYVVEMKKTKETDMIMKTIRNLRKNKEYYMDVIK